MFECEWVSYVYNSWNQLCCCRWNWCYQVTLFFGKRVMCLHWWQSFNFVFNASSWWLWKWKFEKRNSGCATDCHCLHTTCGSLGVGVLLLHHCGSRFRSESILRDSMVITNIQFLPSFPSKRLKTFIIAIIQISPPSLSVLKRCFSP